MNPGTLLWRVQSAILSTMWALRKKPHLHFWEKLLTSLCLLGKQSNLFTSTSSLRWTQAGETDWQTLAPSKVYTSHSNSTLRLIKTRKYNRSHLKWSWSKLRAQTKVKIRKDLKEKGCRYITCPKNLCRQRFRNYGTAKGQLFQESTLCKWLLVFISHPLFSNNTLH